MGAPRFLVESFYNDVANASHVVSANEETVGFEAWRVGAGRRSPGHYWTPTTANAAAWNKVDAGAAKAADMLAIDRVHNLGGVANVKLQKSNDNFAVNIVDVLTFTIPSAASGDNSALSAGVRTPEGAWLSTFPTTSERYWRILVPAMGVNLKPQIGGIWLGTSWVPPNLAFPYAEDDQEPLAEVSVTPWGWEGRTLTVPRRAGELTIKLIDDASYLTADGHIRDQFVKRPMWLVFDDAKAERGLLASWPIGSRAGFRREGGGYRPRQIRLPWVEHEPKVA